MTQHPTPTPMPTPTFALLRLLAAVVAAAPLMVACGGGGGGGAADPVPAPVPVPVPVPVPTVTSAAAGAAVYGQPLLLTVNGTHLDQPISVTSAGCTSITRSTVAPNISTATTAYYTCTVAGYGAQQFSVTRSGAAAALATAAYAVPAPQVNASAAAAATLGQSVLLTLNGSGLDLAMTVTSAGCTGITRSTTAPNISTASTAYYTCTAAVAGAQQFVVTRAGDNLSLATTSYTVPPPPVVSAAAAGAPRYSQPLLLTLTGTNLDQPITVTSPGCNNIARSTTAPNISSATTAYYTCTAASVGAQQFVVVRTYDNANIASAAYTVPVPQVTMTVSNGAAVNGSFVITLAPQQAPITVNNFLNYVNSGFYNGSIFHRLLPTFVIQAGGYDAGVVANVAPVHKITNAAITLEDNAGLSNTNLTVAMARTPAADSATSEFFINLADNLGLNRTATARGYAVFGSITTGANVVTAMKGAPCVAALVSECLPIPNLVITSAAQTQ